MHFLKYIFLLLIFDISYCLACNCKHGITIESSFKEADFVATVTIIESKQIFDTIEWSHSPISHPTPPKVVTSIFYICKAVISKQYKGAKVTDTVNITTPYWGADCSIFFENEQNYIIYGHSSGYKDFGTNICDGTKLFSKKEHKLLLRLSRKYNR